MSGAYFSQCHGADPGDLAARLAGQIVRGGDPINHYAEIDEALLGLVGHDHLNQGIFPRYDDATGLWVVLDGELYDSDARSKLQTKLKTGNDAALFAKAHCEDVLIEHLPDLNGAFFVMLWDPATKTLTCANDRYGLYPMYWAQRGDSFCVASRVLCSVIAGAADGAWDPEGLAMILTIDDFVGETTLVEGVQTYPQATVLTKTGNDLSWHRYWHYDFTPRLEAEGIDAAAERIGGAFVTSVRRQSKHGRSVGVTLSGGLDSRLIVAATQKAEVPAHTFTWGVKGCYDRQFAADVARTFGTTHHDCNYNYQGFEDNFDLAGRLAEGLINYFDAHMVVHLDIMSADAALILNGYAGDVTLGGSFLRPLWMMSNLRAGATATMFHQWRNTLLPEEELRSLSSLAGALPEKRRPSYRFLELMRAMEMDSTPDRVDRFILENRQRRLTAMGTVIMRAAVESSAPFFDYDMIDLQTSVPAEWRLEHRIYKRVMKIAFPETLNIRWQRTLLPAGYPEWMSTPAKAVLKACRISEKAIGWPHIASRQSPVALTKWIAGPLRDWMGAVACEPHAVADEAINREASAAIWQKHQTQGGQERLLGVIATVNSFARALEKARRGEVAAPNAPVRVQGPSS